MRVDPVAIDPVVRLRAQRVEVDLAGREEQLLDLVVDLVAINVHVGEAVVQPQGLDLSDGIGVSLFVPQANVVDQCRVRLYIERRSLAERKELLPAIVQGIGLARGLDMALDVLLLQLQFVGADVQCLDRERHGCVQRNGTARDVSHRLEARRGDQRDRQQQRDHDHPAQGQLPDFVQVVHADHEVVIRQQQRILAQVEPRGSPRQRDAGDDLGKAGLGRPR